MLKNPNYFPVIPHLHKPPNHSKDQLPQHLRKHRAMCRLQNPELGIALVVEITQTMLAVVYVESTSLIWCESEYYINERAQVRSFSLTHTERTSREKSAQICALFMKYCLLLELIYDTIFVSKTSRYWWNQGIFRPALFGFAAVAASRNNASCDGSGPRGLGFESRHSDQKSGIRFCGFRILLSVWIRII